MADYRNIEVSIIGAGMGGLAAALAFARKGFRQIHVYENAPALGFVGAGIQMAPNVIRVLDRLGVWQDSIIQKEGTSVREVFVYGGATNRELNPVPMVDIHQKYGYSHYVGHRASLAGGLFEAAEAQPNVHFHFNETLEAITSFWPSIVTFLVRDKNETDVLVGADGIKSTVRDSMLSGLGLSAETHETGTAAYRILINRERMEADPELLVLIESNAVRRWIGPKEHIIAYPIHNHAIYNIATAQPDTNFADTTNATWTNRGNKKVMMSVYADFCPLVQKLLDLIPDGDVVERRLRSHKPLETWIRDTVALLGDACHPTLPHLSQGAAMSIEDAASLAEVLSWVPGGGADRGAIAKALQVYELLRKDRTTTLVDLAAASARTLHLGEGEAKEERDRQFATARTNGEPLPDRWASPEVQEMIYEYDCIQDAQQGFDELYYSVKSRM